jgi:hypothetical protein
VPGLAEPVFLLWLYERVPGARVEGQAEPGARVVAETTLRVHGVRLPYQAWTEADARGRFRLRLPLPNDESAPGFESASRYRLRAGDRPLGELSLGEGAVRRGERVMLAAAEPLSAPAAP